jgi:hypothetical protein
MDRQTYHVKIAVFTRPAQHLPQLKERARETNCVVLRVLAETRGKWLWNRMKTAWIPGRDCSTIGS